MESCQFRLVDSFALYLEVAPHSLKMLGMLYDNIKILLLFTFSILPQVTFWGLVCVEYKCMEPGLC